VEVERQRNKFSSQNIESLLEETLLDLDDAFQGPLSIDLFDDREFECRDRSHWLSIGSDHKTGAFVGLPAKGRKQGNMWQDCIVRAWNSEDILKVEWKSDHKISELSRLNVLLVAESPALFVDRISKASKQKEAAMASMEYNMFIDSMPIEGVQSLDDDHVARISRRVFPNSNEDGSGIKELIKEVQYSYSRVANKLVLESMLRNPVGDILIQELLDNVVKLKDQMALCGPVELISDGLSKSPFEYAVTGYDASIFAENKKELAFKSLLTQPGLVNSLSVVMIWHILGFTSFDCKLACARY